jgi:hypothetical protein
MGFVQIWPVWKHYLYDTGQQINMLFVSEALGPTLLTVQISLKRYSRIRAIHATACDMYKNARDPQQSVFQYGILL